METPQILHKMVGGLKIAATRAVISGRSDLMPLYPPLQEACGTAICGPAIAIFYYGSVKEGILVEAAYPVTRPVETASVHTRILDAGYAWTVTHQGPHDTLRSATRRILDHLQSHAGTVGGGTREIYLRQDPDNPGNNLTEVQVMDHRWHERLAQGVGEVLGASAVPQVMAGAEALTPGTSAEAYREWIHAAMTRLDGLTSDPVSKYRILTCCAHVFPQHRIDLLRDIYEQRGDIDDVLREMYRDPDWYEDPSRLGSELHLTKVPFDAQAFQNASTPLERRQSYCHCAFVRPYLTESPARISPTFCSCGAGWYRRLWEGILGQPIQVRHVESLVTGGEVCSLVITLPITAAGEFSPELARQQAGANPA